MSVKNYNHLDLEDILTDKAVEEDLLEVPLTNRVFRFFLIITSGIVIAVLVQLLNVGALKHSFYDARALANISYEKIDPVPRGIIADRFGKTIVKNEPAFNVFISPRFLPKEINERLAIFQEISGILGINNEELNKKIASRNWNLTDRILISSDLSHDGLVMLSSKNIPGVLIEPGFKRVHLPSLKFSHVVGYTGLVNEADLKSNQNLRLDDEVGKSGIEEFYDSYLRGERGEEIFFKNAKEEIEETRKIRDPKSGLIVETFIDRDLQERFYDSLEEILKSLGRNAGVGIALNPQNGEVLALISIPGFDSIKIAESLNNPHNPLFNRAISGVYNPGSTIKPLVATAALYEGIIDSKKRIFSAGFIEVPNPYNPESPSRFVDWKAHGWVDLRSALARSSNVYFYEVGGGFKNQKGLGILKLKEWWQKFGLDQKTKIDLIGEKSGFLPDPDWKEKNNRGIWRLGDTYNASIGQGDLSVTPIELLNYISAIANGGKFYALRVMKDIKNEKGEIVLKSDPVLLKDISGEIKGVVEEVRAGMRDGVVETYGMAHLLSGLPMTVAAKTGSAQIENNTKVNAFVVAYAPVENPQIAILVLVENAREGSLNTVPVAKDVLQWYYEHRIKGQKKTD